jgi:hypothetical protein
MRIFLSHSTADRVIAEAVKKLLENVFGSVNLQVDYSSDQEAGGGIPPGALWLPWITDHIQQSDWVYVLLTPGSMVRPWVLWESGAAAGVALGSGRGGVVIPVTFGVPDARVPSPLSAAQLVRGDSAEAGGITRLLQNVNKALGEPLSRSAFDSTVADQVPGYLASVKVAVEQSTPRESLLASVPHLVTANDLTGLWVTCYAFKSRQSVARHADVVKVTAETQRRLRAEDYGLSPRTDGHPTPFRDVVDAEIANRHLLGHWRNVSDTRYFGAIHLAILPGENVMEGHYTSFKSDVAVTHGRWKWVRLSSETTPGADLSRLILRSPSAIDTILEQHSNYAGPLALSDIVEGT